MRIAALCILLAAAPAAADSSRISVLAGLGARHEWGPDAFFYDAGDVNPVLAAEGTIAYRVTDHIAYGVHLAAATGAHYKDESDGDDLYDLVSFDVAAAAQYVGPRFTLTAWVGRHATRFRVLQSFRGGDPQKWTDNFTSYGATASVDLWRHECHAIGVFADAQGHVGSGKLYGDPGIYDELTYAALTIGVAYRR